MSFISSTGAEPLVEECPARRCVVERTLASVPPQSLRLQLFWPCCVPVGGAPTGTPSGNPALSAGMFHTSTIRLFLSRIAKPPLRRDEQDNRNRCVVDGLQDREIQSWRID
jgi:hypothetical protein